MGHKNELGASGATCMLVLHFIQGLSAKLQLLCGIAERLNPGAPLFLSSINGDGHNCF